MERIDEARVQLLCDKIDAVTKELADLKSLFLSLDKPEVEELSNILSNVLKAFETKSTGTQGVVYSVVPLEVKEIERLETHTAELLKKPVSLKNEIDERLIGGFVISVDGKLIDASIKKKIEDMSLRIKANTEGGNLL